MPMLRLCSLARPALLLALAQASLVACGGDEARAPRPKVVEQRPVQETDHLHGVRATSEIGGLNEDAVETTFKSSLGALQRCLNQGSSRVEFLAGSVAFFLKIGGAGRVEHAHLESSTLGDRETERCMLAALRKKTWPKPVGGEVGLARKSFEFDAPNDVRPPTDWAEEEVRSAVQKLNGQLRSCKNGSRRTFQATAYVAADGSVLSASVTPPDEQGEEEVDCLVEVIQQATFPSPGSWPAKVSFSL
jgi:hypothetical protein